MKYRIYIYGIALLSLITACKENWEEHYDNQPVTSDQNVWEALKKDTSISKFVNYLTEYQYDTLFLTNNTYTIIAPSNEAMELFEASDSITGDVLAYHISKYFIQTPAIKGNRKIQTFNEKFALFQNNPDGTYIDGVPVIFESSLYKNGKYLIIDNVALPKPNLYEYIAMNNPVLKKYIDSEDSVILNKELSTPIGFDDDGNTIYDTVADIINMFEIEYFPVSEEYRNKTATVVFPREENYNDALTAMALSLNAGYNSYEDIPLIWQNEVLIPYLLERGVFENMLEREEFLQKAVNDTVKLKNILGDSVVIDYEPTEKTICSNGYAYDYDNFVVPDTLYNAPTFYEGEWWLKTLGNQTYGWNEGVTNVSDITYKFKKEYVGSAHNDTIFSVMFNGGYTGRYSVEFNVENLFPRTYVGVIRTITRVGGLYEIYVNDQLVRTFDYNLFSLNGGVINSVVAGKRYRLEPLGYNRFDFWVKDLTEYGKAKIRIEYKGPSTLSSNGLVIDYIQFVPYNN